MLISMETDINSLFFDKNIKVISLYNLDMPKLEAVFKKIIDNSESLKKIPFKAAFVYQDSSVFRKSKEVESVSTQYREVLFQLEDFTGSISLDIPDEETFDTIFTSHYKKNMASTFLNRINFHGPNAKSFTERLRQQKNSENNQAFSTASIISHLHNNSNEQVNRASHEKRDDISVGREYLKKLEAQEKSNTTLIKDQATQIQDLQQELDSLYAYIHQQQELINNQTAEIKSLKNQLNQGDTFLEQDHTKKRSRK